MFHQQNRIYSNLLFAADILLAFPALYLSYYLRYYTVRWAPEEWSRFFNPELLPFREYLFYLLILLPVWGILLQLTQRYRELLKLSLRRQMIRALQFLLVLGFLMGFLTYTLKLEISRPVFFTFLILLTGALVVNRVLIHWVLRSRNINEHNQIKIVIVGTDEKAREVGRILERSRKWGYDVVGYVARDEVEGPPRGKGRVLGSLRDLPQLLQDSMVVDEIIFAGSRAGDPPMQEEMIALCQELGIRTRLAVDLLPTSTSRVSLEFLENLPLITFSTVPDHSLAIVAKRLVDFVVAMLGLVLLAPVLFLIGLAIKFTTPGPVFYRQVRCGLYGRKFELIKFRTMVEGAEDRLWEIRHLNEMDGPVFKMRNDPRVTPLGRILRRYSLDELPQLWNVIKGEMSLVGPRAPLPEEVRCYTVRQRRRLSVKPGITCLWQVSGRSDVDFHRWMDLDLYYIDHWSFWLDLRIMLKTIPAVFTGRGAR